MSGTFERLLILLIEIGIIIFWCIPGVIIRYYTTQEFSYPNNLVFGTLYVQVIGCFILGLVNSFKKEFESSTPIYPGLTSGCCGSITTFSTWQFDISSIIFGLVPYSISAKHKVFGVFSQLIYTTASSYAAYIFGNHAGDLLVDTVKKLTFKTPPQEDIASIDALQGLVVPSPQNILEVSNLIEQPVNGPVLTNKAGLSTHLGEPNSPNQSSSLLRTQIKCSNLKIKILQSVDRHSVVIAIEIIISLLGWMVYIFLAVFTGIEYNASSSTKNVKLLLEVAFGPPGALLRWGLSKRNKPHQLMPFGTLYANLGGVAILTLANSFGTLSSTRNKCLLLKAGLGSGFCGCLSTISTFTFEIIKLRRPNAYFYYFVSVFASQIIAVIILEIFINSTSFNFDLSLC